MRPTENIKSLLKKLNFDADPQIHQQILDDALAAQAKTKILQNPAASIAGIWRTIMKSKITKRAAVAVGVVALLMGIHLLSVDGAGKAFAAAIDSVKQARTFSCREIFETVRDGQKVVLEQEWMFKEPDLSRHVYLSGVDDRCVGQVTITDYRKRQQLELDPSDKTATFYDKSSEYVIDAETGELGLSQLDTSLRDQLLQMRIGAVEDLGTSDLYGRLAHMLQSRQDSRITTLWIDPQSGLPIQIEIKWPGQSRAPVTYTSIHIDEQLDDNLFSLEPPDGYHLKKFTNEWPVNKKKVSVKMMYLLLQCAIFMQQHDGQYPQELADLKLVGVKNEVLRTILTAPNQPDGTPVIQYIPPRSGTDWSKKAVMCEIHDKWPDEGVVVGFADGHCELIANQQLFEDLLKQIIEK